MFGVGILQCTPFDHINFSVLCGRTLLTFIHVEYKRVLIFGFNCYLYNQQAFNAHVIIYYCVHAILNKEVPVQYYLKIKQYYNVHPELMKIEKLFTY